MDSAIFLDLAERVEALEGPCRETDARIAVAIGDILIRGNDEAGYRAFDRDETGRWHFLWQRMERGSVDDAYRSLGKLLSSPKHYTASLDAVVSLIERDGWGWSVGRNHDFFLSPGERPFAADIMGNVREVPPRWGDPPELAYDTHAGKGTAACRALLAAFLRAKAAQEKTDDQA